MKKAIATLFVIFTALACGSAVHAFGISPVKQYLTITPGTGQLIYVEVSNSDSVAKKFDVGILGVKQNDKGIPIFGEHLDEAENWVIPEARNVEILPNSTKKIEFAVAVPFGTQSGGHYVGLVVREGSADWSDVGISGELASIVTIQVAGETRENVSVEMWKTSGWIKIGRQWNFFAKLQNNGNIDTALMGEVRVRSWGENIVYGSAVNLGNRLLANTGRSVEIPILVSDDATMWPGLYRVEIKVQYGRLGQTISSVQNLIYLPIWPSLLCVVVFFIIIALFVLLKNKLSGK